MSIEPTTTEQIRTLASERRLVRDQLSDAVGELSDKLQHYDDVRLTEIVSPSTEATQQVNDAKVDVSQANEREHDLRVRLNLVERGLEALQHRREQESQREHQQASAARKQIADDLFTDTLDTFRTSLCTLMRINREHTGSAATVEGITRVYAKEQDLSVHHATVDALFNVDVIGEDTETPKPTPEASAKPAAVITAPPEPDPAKPAASEPAPVKTAKRGPGRPKKEELWIDPEGACVEVKTKPNNLPASTARGIE